jgi:ABC-type transport system substrate-binding protein
MKLGRFVVAAFVLTGCASAPSTSASMSADPSAEARLPLGAPLPLAAGTYLTPEGFEPIMSVTLPDGWYAFASENDFGVGQGFDDVNQTFDGGGFLVSPIAMPYDEAVAEFEKLEGLAHDREPTTGTFGGYEATTFYAHATGDNVVLDPIAPGFDIVAAPGQQVFIEANGTTILIRMEINDEAARAEIEEVLASIEFLEAAS